MNERVGGLINGAPWLAFVVTLVLLLVMARAALVAFTRESGRAWVAWVAVGLMIYNAVVTPWAVSRMKQASREQMTSFRWGTSLAPSFYGFGAAALGADKWVLALGLVASVVMLVYTAIGIARGA